MKSTVGSNLIYLMGSSFLSWALRLSDQSLKRGSIPSGIYLCKENDRNVRALCGKDARTILVTSFWCFHSWIWTNKYQLGCTSQKNIDKTCKYVLFDLMANNGIYKKCSQHKTLFCEGILLNLILWFVFYFTFCVFTIH